MRRLSKADREYIANLQASIANRAFLRQWVDDAEKGLAFLLDQQRAGSPAALAALASGGGFRTWSQALAHQRDMQRVLKHFAEHPSFEALWNAARAFDEELGYPGAFGPQNGALPASILRGVERWHHVPKFSRAERRRHALQIVKHCDELARLVGQVAPDAFSNSFDRFFVTDDQARGLAHRFGSNAKFVKAWAAGGYGVRSSCSNKLQQVGITPEWAIGQLRDGALRWEHSDSGLPTKVHAASVKRTFFIGVVNSCLDFAERCGGGLAKLEVSQQLRADIVGLLANVDCTADDVRKAVASR